MNARSNQPVSTKITEEQLERLTEALLAVLSPPREGKSKDLNDEEAVKHFNNLWKRVEYNEANFTPERADYQEAVKRAWEARAFLFGSGGNKRNLSRALQSFIMAQEKFMSALAVQPNIDVLYKLHGLSGRPRGTDDRLLYEKAKVHKDEHGGKWVAVLRAVVNECPELEYYIDKTDIALDSARKRGMELTKSD